MLVPLTASGRAHGPGRYGIHEVAVPYRCGGAGRKVGGIIKKVVVDGSLGVLGKGGRDVMR